MYGHGSLQGRFICSIHAFADAVVYSSVYLSIASCAMMYIAGVLEGLPFTPLPCVIGFCITFAIYNLNRKSDEAEDSINHAGRYLFTKRYERQLLILSAAAYAAALVLAWRYSITAVIITAFPLITGIVYSVPFFPQRSRFRRLKDIPVVKNLSIAIAWAVPHAFLPAVLAGSLLAGMTGAVLLFFFILVFINTVLFDMRDVEGDAAAGIRTVPVILGVAGTTRVLLGSGIIAAILVPLLSLPLVPGWQTGVLFFGILYGVGYLLWFQGSHAKNAICDIVADGQFIVIGAALYVASAIAG